MVILVRHFPDPGRQKIVWAITNLTFMYGWTMFHNKILMERLLIIEKRILVYFVGLSVGFIFWLLASRLSAAQGDFPFQQSEAAVGFVWYTLFGSSIFLSLRYFQSKSEFYDVNMLKREVEVNQLKAQLNPHFLFNALNNIYSYNLENSSHGNDLVLKLSQLMRYVVESTRHSSIPISQEVGFLQDYLAFEKERLGYRCRIWYNIDLTQPERMVPPLILFPLVENAFKHGTNTSEETEVEISLSDNEEIIHLAVRNEIIRSNVESTKTGLSNTKKRLDLLFPGKHSLETRHDAHFFDAELTLWFS